MLVAVEEFGAADGPRNGGAGRMKYTGIYREDETEIRKGYTDWVLCLVPSVPLVVAASGAELKWIVGSGLSAAVFFLWLATGRLFDLCIRLRRTNIILSNLGE
jgi:hypothetical protein